MSGEVRSEVSGAGGAELSSEVASLSNTQHRGHQAAGLQDLQ